MVQLAVVAVHHQSLLHLHHHLIQLFWLLDGLQYGIHGTGDAVVDYPLEIKAVWNKCFDTVIATQGAVHMYTGVACV